MNSCRSGLRSALACTVLAVPGLAQQFAPDPLQALPAVASNPARLATVDTDGDGDLDLLVANSQGQNRLFENDGHGAFSDASGRLPADTDTTLALAAGDVDGDGDPDVVWGNAWQQNRLALNQAGTFTDATAGRLPSVSDATQALLLCDVDGDGDLDLVVGNQNAVNALLLNDGTGRFTDVTATRMPNDTDNTHALGAADVDGDGDLDLVVGNDRNGNHLLLNDGTGRFSKAAPTAFPLFGDATFDLAVADVDGDLRPDVFFANGLGQNRLYLNQGNGRFADRPANLPANNNGASFAIALSDADGDGDLDAAIGTSFGQNELWLNDGRGVFHDATARLPAVLNATPSVLLADVDQDGDLDLVFGNGGGPVLYANHLQHLSATGSLQLGQTWTLLLARHDGATPPPAFALPALAVGPRIAAVTVPGLGALLIDPTAMVLLPQVNLAAPGGRGNLPLLVPQDPSLRNLRIAAQAVVAASQNPGAARLTNAIAGVVQ